MRGMATLLVFGKERILLDPGCTLAPRFSLPPHEQEYLALSKARERISKASKRSQIILISHYHLDHYTPPFVDWQWTYSSPELARELYKGKIVLLKDYEGLPPTQRRRGYLLQKFLKGICEVIPADSQRFTFGSITIEASEPLSHGPFSQAKVLYFSIRAGGHTFVFSPDLQGLNEELVDVVLAWKPDVLVASGPPLHLLHYKLTEGDIQRATENLVELVSKIRMVVLDHHLFRSTDGEKYLRSIAERAREVGNRVLCAAEARKTKPNPLEARRKELYESDSARSSDS